MLVDCILVVPESEGLGIYKTTRRIELSAEIEKLKSNQTPTVYLFAQKDLDLIRKHTNIVLDKGLQHNGTALSTRMMGGNVKKTGKIPLIAAKYTSVKRTLNGIGSLFNSIAEDNSDSANATFIIGIKQKVFDTLWHDAHNETPVHSPEAQTSSHAKTTASVSDKFKEKLKRLEDIHGLSSELEEIYLGNSELIRMNRVMIIAASKIQTPVLILGENGTGKDVVASAIHNLSGKNRLKGGLTIVNCAAIPEHLFEFELFGCAKGALQNQPERKGLWEAAGKGTLFLDEIGDLPLFHQAKILRALENGTIRPIGANKDIRVEARVIAATNRDLPAMVRTGKFRRDLLSRLESFIIRTPELKDHLDDVPLLANSFWRKFTENKKSFLPNACLEVLSNYSWSKYNVRELRNTLKELYILYSIGGKEPSVKDVEDCLPETDENGTRAPAMSEQIFFRKNRAGANTEREGQASCDSGDNVKKPGNNNANDDELGVIITTREELTKSGVSIPAVIESAKKMHVLGLSLLSTTLNYPILHKKLKDNEAVYRFIFTNSLARGNANELLSENLSRQFLEVKSAKLVESHFLNTLRNVQDLVQRFPEKIQVRLYGDIPPFGILMYETAENKIMNVDFYLDRCDNTYRPIMQIKKNKRQQLFEIFSDQYDKIWEKSVPWDGIKYLG